MFLTRLNLYNIGDEYTKNNFGLPDFKKIISIF